MAGHAEAPVPPLRKAAGPIGWALGVITGVVFLGALYQSAHSHHEAPAAPAAAGAEAAPAAH
jgi:hypothetical protein